MNNLKLVFFLIPVIALILTGILYFSLLKKATEKRAFNKFIIVIIVLAFLLNFIWELIQVPFYKGSFFSTEHIVFCGLASMVDAIMDLLLYFGFASIFKNPFWMHHSTWQRIVMVVLISGVAATLIKIWHLSPANWAYTNSMPNISTINIGLSAVLQFIILPVPIYFLSLSYLKLIKK